MGLPKVHVSFLEAAKTFVPRSETGIVGLILRDEVPTINPVIITDATEIPASLSDANKKQMELAMLGAEKSPQKVIAYVIQPDDTEEEITYDYSDALSYFEDVEIDYLAAPNVAIDDLGDDIQTWITTQRADGRTVKAVLPNAEADNIGIINYATSRVEEDDESYTTAQYCARIAGLLAAVPITMSATFWTLPELTGAARMSKSDMDTAIDAGKLIVFWDGEKVKVARGVNSFQTTTETMGDMFKKIRMVEIMDKIQKDIRRLAEDNYIGKFSNTYANKCLFLSAVKDYFDELEKQGVLTVKECDIDEKANKNYLVDHDIDVTDWTDTEIREANTGDTVFLKATLSLFDAIEDIVLPITV